jgi:DNA-binding NtrC family response regulator
MLSRTHFSVCPVTGDESNKENLFLIRDHGSRNGTFLNGNRLDAPCIVSEGQVVRAGSCVFVTVKDLNCLAAPGDHTFAHMAGRFHTASIIRKLQIAATTNRHVLLEGESGTGKELAAKELHRLFIKHGDAGPLLCHNAAFFAGEDDAIGSLFGVSPGAFTGVGPRAGMLEASHEGALFLDELQSLPLRVQRSLLRFVEDGLVHVLGQPISAQRANVKVRLIFGTNINVEQACDDGILAHDLVARLHRVHIPPLRERRADIPSIFVHLLKSNTPTEAASTVLDGLRAADIERLCLEDFQKGNARELLTIATTVGARLSLGDSAVDAISATLNEYVAPISHREMERDLPTPSNGSIYELSRAEILAVYREVRGNLSQLESVLNERGIPCTHKWLSIYLDRWGVRAIKRRK